MSTGGKVLVVLITLLTIAWVGLMSLVTRHNANHGELVKKGEAALVSLEQQVEEATTKLRDLENEVEAKHFVNDRDRTKSRLEFNDQQKALAELQENLARMNGLLENLDRANEKTEENIAARTAETALTQKTMDETRLAVDESKGLNASLLTTLTDLRNRFVKLSEENRELAQRLGKQGFEDVSAGKRALVTGR